MHVFSLQTHQHGLLPSADGSDVMTGTDYDRADGVKPRIPRFCDLKYIRQELRTPIMIEMMETTSTFHRGGRGKVNVNAEYMCIMLSARYRTVLHLFPFGGLRFAEFWSVVFLDRLTPCQNANIGVNLKGHRMTTSSLETNTAPRIASGGDAPKNFVLGAVIPPLALRTRSCRRCRVQTGRGRKCLVRPTPS